MSARSIIALLLALAILAPLRARACSCVPPRLARTALPADGTSDFPVDGVLRVFLTGGFPEPLRAALASEYRLRDANGGDVPLDATLVGTRLDLRPRAPLSPGARYTLESVFAYDGAGVRLSDTERWAAARRGTNAAARTGFFAVASFTTAPTPRARRVTPQITTARLRFARGGGDCGPGVGLHAELSVPGAAPTDVLELRARGGLLATVAAADATHVHASDLLCNPDPVTLPARSAQDVELVVVDTAGREIGSSGWQRATGQPRFALSRDWARHRRTAAVSPEVQAAVALWTSATPSALRAARRPGPRGCEHGLEAIAAHEVASSHGPWVYEAQSTLASDGARAFLALSDAASTTRVLRVAADGSASAIASGVPGLVGAGAVGARGPYAIASAYGSVRETALHALGVDGQARFRQPLSAQGQSFRIVPASGRVLVTWLERQAPLDRRVAWALFDDASGAPIGAPAISGHAVHTNGGLAAAHVRDRFFVAWPAAPLGSRPTAMLLALAPDGTTSVRSLGVPSNGPLDLASTGTHVAMVTAADGEIAWHLLDDAGRIVRGPVVVSEGVGGRDNRKPRIAYGGEVFAVAWETHPSHRTYVTALDAEGRVAPALALEPDRSTSTVGIAPLGRGFVAAYTAEPYGSAPVITRALRCRSGPPPGPPQRIEP